MTLIYKHLDFERRGSGRNVWPKHRWDYNLKQRARQSFKCHPCGSYSWATRELIPRTESTVQRAKGQGPKPCLEDRRKQNEQEKEERAERHCIHVKYRERSKCFFSICLHYCLLSKEKYSTIVPTALHSHPEGKDLINWWQVKLGLDFRPRLPFPPPCEENSKAFMSFWGTWFIDISHTRFPNVYLLYSLTSS